MINMIKITLLAAILVPNLVISYSVKAAHSLSKVQNVKEVVSCFAGSNANYDNFVEQNLSELKSNLGKRAKNLTKQMITKNFSKKKFALISQNFDCQQMTYEVDGVEVEGFYLRVKSSEAPQPLLIFNRGGNGNFGRVSMISFISQYMAVAKAGYVVMGSQYRQQDEFGGADLNDVLALVEIGAELPETDQSKVNMMGVSRGGMMTYLAAKLLPNLKSIIVWAGQSDLAKGLEIRPEMERVHKARIPNYKENKESELKQRSVMFWLDKLNPTLPILLLHGDADRAVHVSQSTRLASKLTDLNWPHKLVVYPNGNHGLSRHKKQAMNEVIGWLNQHNH